jgi:hypothetical protein
MFTNKDKERVVSPTGSIAITVIVLTVLQKNTYPKIKLPDIFLGDRKKFKVYEAQCRMYL